MELVARACAVGGSGKGHGRGNAAVVTVPASTLAAGSSGEQSYMKTQPPMLLQLQLLVMVLLMMLMMWLLLLWNHLLVLLRLVRLFQVQPYQARQ
jgi:hypothetical protein